MSVYDGLTFKIEGLAELEKALMQLTKAAGKAVLRNALKKAGVPIRDAAIAKVPVGPTGNLRKSIIVSTTLRKSQRPRGFRDRTAVNVFVGPDSKIGPHAHLVEFGTGPRYLKKPRRVSIRGHMVTITHTGQMPAKPFLRPAFDATKREALDIFATEVWKELVKVSGRLAKKAGRGTLGKAQIRSLLR